VVLDSQKVGTKEEGSHSIEDASVRAVGQWNGEGTESEGR